MGETFIDNTHSRASPHIKNLVEDLYKFFSRFDNAKINKLYIAIIFFYLGYFVLY